MIGPISYILEKFVSFNSGNATKTIAGACNKTVEFIERLTTIVGIFVYILYIVAAAFPSWPLYNECSDFWMAHLLMLPLASRLLARDSATTAPIYVIKLLAFLSIAIGIRPYVFLIREIYVCSDLTDAEKESLATCSAALTGNYIDPNSQLACANLVNVDRATLGHGDCAYLIDYVQGAVQAFEFITLVLLTYADMLIYFAADKFIKFRDERSNDRTRY